MILDEFYETLLSHIETMVPEIKHIDMYDGQYDDPQVDDQGNPIQEHFMRPALFIQFPANIEMEPLSMRRKTATIIFSAHLVQDVVQEVNKRTTKAIRKKAHAHMALVDKLQANLEGFNGNQVTEGFNQFDAISWVGINPYLKMGQQITHILQFKVKLTSDNTRIKYVKLYNLDTPIVAQDIINFQVINLNPLLTQNVMQTDTLIYKTGTAFNQVFVVYGLDFTGLSVKSAFKADPEQADPDILFQTSDGSIAVNIISATEAHLSFTKTPLQMENIAPGLYYFDAVTFTNALDVNPIFEGKLEVQLSIT
jgi:hypothetical protein